MKCLGLLLKKMRKKMSDKCKKYIDTDEVNKENTAKEMFESLGYKQTKNNDDLIEYRTVTHEDSNYIYIIFYLGWEEYEVGSSNIYQVTTDIVVPVTTKEHKAITKQMKELGWI